jgi:16S rRNA (cytidine1402-2'-O)-methyltransferase
VGTVYLVSTPIGNLEDISLRALRVLKEVSLIASEDTRRTRKLLARYGIGTRQVSYHEHSPPSRLASILEALQAGDVALVSDAGTPGLSDPGFDLVRSAWAGGHTVRPIPGASAPLAALVASGLPSEAFLYLGYLVGGKTRKLLDRYADEPATLVCFEVPHRLRTALADLEAVLGADRAAAVCRELTKLHEDIRRGTLAELRRHFAATEPLGEFTLVIAGAPAPAGRKTSGLLCVNGGGKGTRFQAARHVAALRAGGAASTDWPGGYNHRQAQGKCSGGSVNLDDLDRIRAIDREQMAAKIDDLPDQIERAWSAAAALPLPEISNLRHIIFAGMGGSAIGADLACAHGRPRAPA